MLLLIQVRYFLYTIADIVQVCLCVCFYCRVDVSISLSSMYFHIHNNSIFLCIKNVSFYQLSVFSCIYMYFYLFLTLCAHYIL